MVGLRTAFHLLVLMIFVTWVEGQSEISLGCSDLGGECVSKEDTTCPFKVDSPGCDEDETCCYLNGPQQKSACTEEDPLKKCKKTNFGGVCQSECREGRIQVANCTDGCKCCGCKPKANCLLKKGFCMKKDSTMCTGETNNKWCKGKKCTCCIPDCPATPDCLSAGGRCAVSCGDDEETHPSIECTKENNAACLCCVPKKCVDTKLCTLLGGHCKDKCNYFKSEVSHRTFLTCGLQGCVCCFNI